MRVPRTLRSSKAKRSIIATDDGRGDIPTTSSGCGTSYVPFDVQVK